MTPAERFWAKVDHTSEDGCWPWRASTSRGYGSFNDPAFPTHRAHRIAFLLANGHLDPRLDVCHSCDVPICCRPAHLWQGTRAENNLDMARKGRANGGHPGKYGTAAPRHKLTEDQAAAILAAKRSGGSTKLLSRQYGVSTTVVKKIANGSLWPHLTVGST